MNDQRVRANNFDVLRLLAALLVLWGHSYPLTGTSKDDVFSQLLRGYDMAGTFAVTVFLVISGFLVARSAADRSAVDFILARCLRILPALAFALLLTVFVFGPLLTKMPLAQYFSDPSVFTYLGNIAVFGIQHHLADTTAALPHSHTINGSLWTLSLECGFYLLLLSLVKFGLFGPLSSALIFVVVLASYCFCIYGLGLNWEKQGI